MTNPNEAFEAITAAEKALAEHCGMDAIYYSIADMREYYWRIDGDSVPHDTNRDNLDPEDWEKEATYSDDILHDHGKKQPMVYRGALVTAVLIRNCYGEKQTLFFDNAKEWAPAAL